MFVVRDTFGILGVWKFDDLAKAVKFRTELNRRYNTIARFEVRGNK